MANQIKTVMTYPLTGQVDFPITFEYLARKFIQVSLIGRDRIVLTLNNDYRFSTRTQITTNRSWTTSDDYQYIEIRRVTSATDRLVDFADGSILRAYDLNIAQIQAIHIAEEARDLSADTIGVNEEGNLDARGRRIVNLADPVNDYDALNLHSVKVWDASALNSANKAAKSAQEAADSAHVAYVKSKEAADSAHVAYVNANEAKEAAKEAAESSESAWEAMDYAAINARRADEAGWRAAAAQNGAEEAAERSESAADRATMEANKLGNWNSLAGSVQDVIPESGTQRGMVNWKYDLSSIKLNAMKGLSIGNNNTNSNEAPFLEFKHTNDIWCGTFFTSPDGTLKFNSKSLQFNCDIKTGDVYSNNVIAEKGIILKTGNLFNHAGNYIICDKTAPLNESLEQVPSICLRNGVDNNNECIYTYMDRNKQSGAIGYTVNVVNKSQNMNTFYWMTQTGFNTNMPITIQSGGGAAVLQGNGDIGGAGTIWDGGSLGHHINLKFNKTIIDIRLGGNQKSELLSNKGIFHTPEGSVITGLQWSSNTQKIQYVYYRELIIYKGDGSWYVVKTAEDSTFSNRR